ncbi:MAG TPA: hypothetical protein VGH99_01890, partial [Pseudonocardia sp.]
MSGEIAIWGGSAAPSAVEPPESAIFPGLDRRPASAVRLPGRGGVPAAQRGSAPDAVGQADAD